ncbi:chemotaxis protein CheW [Candidatus Desulforudis audaxviator]|uniref:Chemotaxis protein CheW n=1 Tax=Desulforudis audaxviator (strain MP104C) TaxID=477974 RepID=B1I533_DESAP|nr:chemotaxis protein CheW [Candidatus Desulforudis audaxviator]ACA60062.1 putative CheW protein [Candidatus Desulforudis audaxviator MP104C]AZK60100.1 Positive regulator of CheA protein activity (CheW) [Candidatus Desulforudis audaxviator]
MASTVANEQLVIFDLSGQKYAIPVLNTQEIIKMIDITPIPRADSYIEGVINLRGRIVPIINLNKRLDLARSETTRDTRIIVVEHKETSVGMIVDRVQEVGRYNPDEIERPESVMKENEFVSGVVKKENALWLLLQLDKVLPNISVS